MDPNTIPTSGGSLDVGELTELAQRVLDEIVAAKPGAKRRDAQVQMVADVAAAVAARDDAQLAKLAGCGETGVGKSLGYGVVVAAAAHLARWRTVIATESLNLQKQLAGDLDGLILPAFDRLGLPRPDVAFLSGRSNHLCHLALARTAARLDGRKLLKADMSWELPTDARWEETAARFMRRPSHETSLSDREVGEFRAVVEWAAEKLDGRFDRGSLKIADSAPADPRSRAWAAVTISSSECERRDCRFFAVCHAQQAMTDAAAARVVITNHALLVRRPRAVGSAAVVKRTRRGELKVVSAAVPLDVVVVDEAHAIANSARGAAEVNWTAAWFGRASANLVDVLGIAGSKRAKQLLAEGEAHRRAATDALTELVNASSRGEAVLTAPVGAESKRRCEARAAAGVVFDAACDWVKASVLASAERELVQVRAERRLAGTKFDEDAIVELDRRLVELEGLVDWLVERLERFGPLCGWFRTGEFVVGRASVAATTASNETDEEADDEEEELDPFDGFDAPTEERQASNILELVKLEEDSDGKEHPIWWKVPVEVASTLTELWTGRTAVCVSASLRAASLTEIGMRSAPFKTWQSPFEAGRAASRVFIPSAADFATFKAGMSPELNAEFARLATPKQWGTRTEEKWKAEKRANDVAREWHAEALIVQLVTAGLPGRSLVLCWAGVRMRRFAEALRAAGVDARHQAEPGAVDAFKRGELGVLVGLRASFTGLSVEGLCQVLLEKAPRNPPTALAERRTAWLRTELDDEAADADLEDATTALQQGVGRLIRSVSDFGLIGVLDHRLVTVDRDGVGRVKEERYRAELGVFGDPKVPGRGLLMSGEVAAGFVAGLPHGGGRGVDVPRAA